jgi:hypothetical protein
MIEILVYGIVFILALTSTLLLFGAFDNDKSNPFKQQEQ